MDKEIKVFIIIVLALFIPFYLWYIIRGDILVQAIIVIAFTILLIFISYLIKNNFPKSKIGRIITGFFDIIRDLFCFPLP